MVIRAACSLLISALLSAQLAAVPMPQNATAAQNSQPQQSSSQTPSSGGAVSVDPSAPPQAPSSTPAQTPEAPRPAQTVPPTRAQTPASQQPLGAAAAEQVRTAGGGASRPAGSAIAPTRQRQYHSLLIKWGAVAAAGIAVGTVVGLSRATPSVPPHSGTAQSRR